MTTVQKGIVCSILLIGLQLAAGCLLQEKSRATVDTQTPNQNGSVGLRDRIRDRVNTKLSSSDNGAARSAQPSSSEARSSLATPPKALAASPKVAQLGGRPQVASLIADQFVNRINQSSCTDFRSSLYRLEDRQSGKSVQQKNATRDRLMDAAQSNPEIRKVFIDRVAGPLANKMFDCGMIPPP
jgi:hypothetical protein